RFIRVNADILNATAPKSGDTVDYEVSDIPEEDSDDWMTTLLKSPIFQRLPATNLQKVLTCVEEIQVTKGASILKQGEPGDYYYIIKQGRCSLTRKPLPNAREIKLAELKTTETFGEDSLISGSPRNVNVTMLTDGVLLRMGKETFLELVKKPVIQTVTFDQAMGEYEKGSTLLDVREADDFERAHIPGSRNIPFFSLRMQLNSLNAGKRLILICEDGNTSEAASFLLIRFGFDAVVLKGGFNTLTQENLARVEVPGQIFAKSPERTESARISPAIDSTSKETQALEVSRQIILKLQEQLQAEREQTRRSRDEFQQDLDQLSTKHENTIREAEHERTILRNRIADL
ncbi:MAG: cyclic nucleotide-binding domain-containing protein, partial [Methylococcales bacterium]